MELVSKSYDYFLIFPIFHFSGVLPNFFLTDLKSPQNDITQCFLRSLYIDILIFEYPKSVRWKKSCISALFQHNDCFTLQGLNTHMYPLKNANSTYMHRHHSDDLRHSPDTSHASPDNIGGEKMPKDVNKPQKRPTDTVRV